MEIARSPSSKDSPGVEESSVQWPKTAIQHVKYFFPGKILLSELTDEKIDFLSALSVLGPYNRFTMDRIRESLAEVKASAKRISASLAGIR